MAFDVQVGKNGQPQVTAINGGAGGADGARVIDGPGSAPGPRSAAKASAGALQYPPTATTPMAYPEARPEVQVPRLKTEGRGSYLAAPL